MTKKNGSRSNPPLKRCPICSQLEILTSHHPFPKWIFGDNDVGKFEVGRYCHDDIEILMKKLEAFLLRPHRYAFARASKEIRQIMKRNGNYDKEEVEAILLNVAMVSFEKLLCRATSEYLYREMTSVEVFRESKDNKPCPKRGRRSRKKR